MLLVARAKYISKTQILNLTSRHSFDVAAAVVRAPPDRVRLRESQGQAAGKDVDEVRSVTKPKL